MRVNDMLSANNVKASNAYRRTAKTAANSVKNEKQDFDKIEISEEAKLSLKNVEKDAEAGKPYDLKRILELHYKKDRTMAEALEESAARKSDPKLDAQLYAADKAEALDFVAKVQAILLKAMSGKELTPEEKKMVNDDPLLSSMI